MPHPIILDIVLNVKVLVGAFNQEKALVGVFSVIVKTLMMLSLQLYLHLARLGRRAG